MKQEQKPFEIKKLFTVGFSAVSLEKMAQDGLGDLFFNNAMVKKLSQGLIEANAEIRRLQEKLRVVKNERDLFQRVNANRKDEIESLKQQLADAPTWGEWQDDKNQFQAGTYEVEFDNGNRVLLQANSLTLIVLIDSVTRFRRLNYEPKPAREVEKKYGGDTLRKWAVMEDVPIGQMAKDLIAAQARIKELEGK